MSQAKLSIYLCRLLRHAPEDAGLDMDVHGWVSTQQLIDNVNKAGRYRLTMPQPGAARGNRQQGPLPLQPG